MRRQLRRALVTTMGRPLHWFSNTVQAVAAVNGTLAALYYLLFSRAFRREQQATLAGKVAYHRCRGRLGASSTVLRRNIHRLEKGLIMSPRRIPFALDYLDETVEHFVASFQEGTLNARELEWADHVLAEYFACTGHEPAVERCRRLYLAVKQEAAGGREGRVADRLIPSPQGALPHCPVPYDDILALLKRRRSVRWFVPRPVPRGVVEKAVRAASLAPSACNRQPFWFELLEAPLEAKRVAELAMGTQGFSQNIPCLLVLVGDLQAFPHERDRHVIYIDASLAAMSLMLAIESLGLSSCPINWPDIPSRERAMQRALGLKVHQRPIMLIALGYADPEGGVPSSQKKPVSLLLRCSTPSSSRSRTSASAANSQAPPPRRRRCSSSATGGRRGRGDASRRRVERPQGRVQQIRTQVEETTSD